MLNYIGWDTKLTLTLTLTLKPSPNPITNPKLNPNPAYPQVCPVCLYPVYDYILNK